MAEHEHGSMDTSVQERTYNSFMTFVSRTVVAILVLLVFMAIFVS